MATNPWDEDLRILRADVAQSDETIKDLRREIEQLRDDAEYDADVAWQRAQARLEVLTQFVRELLPVPGGAEATQRALATVFSMPTWKLPPDTPRRQDAWAQLQMLLPDVKSPPPE